MLHESDIKKYTRCDKYYWYSLQEKPEFLPFVTYNMDIYELVKEYFGFEDVLMGKKGDDPEKALQAYKEGKVLLNARIAYRDFRINIPCLFQKDGKTVLYFVYAQCFPKISEAQKAYDTLYVMEKNGIVPDEIRMIHINASYERKDSLDVHECLMVTDEYYNDRNRPAGLIEEHLEACKRDLDALIEEMHHLPDLSLVQKKRNPNCTSHYKCEYFKKCFPGNDHDTSIMNLVQSSKKYDCEQMGIDDMAMVQGDEIEATRVQYAQVMAAKKRGLFVDKAALKSWLSQLTYPITYLDFEWQTYMIPPYEKMKPYDVLVFQYSMHIEDEEGNLTHEQYLGKEDCRIEFIEDLISKIPEKGTILVFNAQGAEALRLQQLAKVFPQYEEALRSIWERMMDLALPFSCGIVYDTRMAGEYNLKKLLSLFSDLSYESLEISQGLLAVKKYRELEETESDEIKEALFEYCGMDTYAEVVILHTLMKLIKADQ